MFIRCREGFRSRAKTSKCHCFGRQRSRISMGRWWVGTYIRWAARRRTVVFFCVKGKGDLTTPNVRLDSIHRDVWTTDETPWFVLPLTGCACLTCHIAWTICYLCGFRVGFSTCSSHVFSSIWRRMLFVHDTPYSLGASWYASRRRIN